MLGTTVSLRRFQPTVNIEELRLYPKLLLIFLLNLMRFWQRLLHQPFGFLFSRSRFAGAAPLTAIDVRSARRSRHVGAHT